MGFLKSLKKISSIKSEIRTLFRAYGDPRTPTSTKFFITLFAIIYISSPIDISPDIIPIVGFVDDILIIPVLMWIFISKSVLGNIRYQVALLEKKEAPNHHWMLWTFGVIFLALTIYTITLLVN